MVEKEPINDLLERVSQLEAELRSSELRVLSLEAALEDQYHRANQAHDQMRQMRNSVTWKSGAVVSGTLDLGRVVVTSANRIAKNVIKGLAP